MSLFRLLVFRREEKRRRRGFGKRGRRRVKPLRPWRTTSGTSSQLQAKPSSQTCLSIPAVSIHELTGACSVSTPLASPPQPASWKAGCARRRQALEAEYALPRGSFELEQRTYVHPWLLHSRSRASTPWFWSSSSCCEAPMVLLISQLPPPGCAGLPLLWLRRRGRPSSRPAFADVQNPLRSLDAPPTSHTTTYPELWLTTLHAASPFLN